MPHNDILNDPKINKVFEAYLEKAKLTTEIRIPLIKEPDYLFVVNSKR